MPMSKALEQKIKAFKWPKKVPTKLDEAWAFLEKTTLPAERFKVAASPATAEALAKAEKALKRKLPEVLREALLRYDGIDETWTKSGPFLAGAAELAGEDVRFKKEWSGFLEESEEIDPETVDLKKLFAIGHDQSGHVCFLLDTSKKSAAGEHPVLRFDPEMEEMPPRWPSLGNFIAWIVCDAHTNPQAMPPEEMAALFPEPEGDDDEDDDD